MSDAQAEGEFTMGKPAVIAQARSLLYDKFAKEGEENNLCDAFGKCKGTQWIFGYSSRYFLWLIFSFLAIKRCYEEDEHVLALGWGDHQGSAY